MSVARTVTFAAAAVILSCIWVQAECISPPPPCEALKQDAVVVLVDVLEARIPTVENRPNLSIGRQDVRLRVRERFKGVGKDQTEIEATIPFTAEAILLEH